MRITEFTKIIVIIFFGIAITILNSCKKDKEEGPDQIAYDAADKVNGGRLYDKFWADETNFTAPVEQSISLNTITDYGEFYRCKACHGWDQLGNAASYIDRGPTISRPNVASNNIHEFVANSDIRPIFDAIKKVGGRAIDASLTADGTTGSGDGHPDFSKILSDAQIWDLVKFLKEGAFDVTELYNITLTGTYPTGTKLFYYIGRVNQQSMYLKRIFDRGLLFFADNCASCHGDNGRDDSQGNPLTINQNIGMSIGEFTRNKPYEIQHKSVYGNLGSTPAMLGINDATLNNISDMMYALTDTLVYPNL